jgi:uncharacterized protein YndB with AHSA1/START domain
MNDAALKSHVRDIVVDAVFAHPPETLWKVLTDGTLMARWLMAPTGFDPVPGNHFTFQTTPAGEWDGVIHCEVIEVMPNERLAYRWQGGHRDNVGYGSMLDTVVTWTLAKIDQGTRLRLVHSGFVTPNNDSALKSMGEAWKKVVHKVGDAAALLH